MTPPQVHIKARFIEVEQDDSKALGFDWYLGQINMGNVVGNGGSSLRLPIKIPRIMDCPPQRVISPDRQRPIKLSVRHQIN